MTLQANDIRLAHSISTGSDFQMLTEEEKLAEDKNAAGLDAYEQSDEDDLSPGEEGEEGEDDYSGDSEDEDNIV